MKIKSKHLANGGKLNHEISDSGRKALSDASRKNAALRKMKRQPEPALKWNVPG